MQTYHYSPDTLNFIAAGLADQSPLEEGVYLIPAYATDVKPPAFNSDTQLYRFLDGSWVVNEISEPVPGPEPALKTLSEIKTDASNIIDQTAGSVRQKYITTCPGQETTYTEKSRQCDAYKAAGYPTPPDPVLYAYIIAEKNAHGGSTTYRQACDVILTERDAWLVVGGKIEEARRKAKIAINAATGVTEVETAKESGLAELSVL